MDAGQLLQLFVLLAIASLIGQRAIGSAGRAGDGLAMLFVPPDRGLGWPRGVQESDEPWGWHSPPGPTDARSPGSPGGGDDPDDGREDDPARWIEARHGALVVPVGRVAPVRLIVRPH